MKRWWSIAVVAFAWILVAAAQLFQVPLFNTLWLAALIISFGTWIAAGLATVVVAATAMSTRRWVAAGSAVLLGVGAGVAIARTDWTSAYVHGYYRWHRDDFAAVAALDDQGRLASDDYYGAELPDDLRGLSITGRAAGVSPMGQNSPSALFVPRVSAFPDGGAGYARLAAEQRATTFDCFADPCRVRWELGDGWYWLG